MPYLPETLPAVQPTLDDQKFWAYCRERSLRFQTCARCGTFRHPPMPLCPKCHSDESAWTIAKGPMLIFTYTWVHHPAHPEVKASLPYNVALVEFPACGHVRLVSNVVDASQADLVIGREVFLHWELGNGGQFLPRFRLKS